MDYNKLPRPLECHITYVTHRGQSAYYIRAIDDLPNGASRSFYLTDPGGLYLAFERKDAAAEFCRRNRDLKIYPSEESVDTEPVLRWLVSKDPAELAYEPMGRAFAFCEAATDCYDRVKGGKKYPELKKYLDVSMINYIFYNCECEYEKTGTNRVPEFSEYQLSFIKEVFENASEVFDSMFRDRVLDESEAGTVTPITPSPEDMQAAMTQCEGSIQRAAKHLCYDMGYSHISIANLKMCLQQFKPAEQESEPEEET